MRKRVNIILVGCLGLLTGYILGGYRMGHKYCIELIESRKLVEKHLHMVRLYDIWLMTKQSGASIEKYLMDKGIHRITIYGMSFMGIRLFHELRKSDVHVEYGIDREPKMRIPELTILHPDKADTDKVDAVVVTAVFTYDAIKKDLEKLGFTRIIALDEILYDLV